MYKIFGIKGEIPHFKGIPRLNIKISAEKVNHEIQDHKSNIESLTDVIIGTI